MAYDWTIIEEGSSLSASDLNDRFTAVKDEINDLPELSVQPSSLHHKHLPSMVAVVGRAEVGTNQHIYGPYPTGATPVQYYPGYTGSSAHTPSWTVVSDQPTGPDLQVLHTSEPIGVAASVPNVVYIVMANIQMSDLRDSVVTADKLYQHRVDHYGIFKIELYIRGADPSFPFTYGWYGIESSERYAVSETNNGRNASITAGTWDEDNHGLNNYPPYKNIPIWIMITPQQIRDIGYTADQIAGARVVCAVQNVESSNVNLKTQITLHRCNLSVFALYSPITEI